MKRIRNRQLVLNYCEQLVLCYHETLSLSELRELELWEKLNLPSATLGTTDWPGWEKHLGKSPMRVTNQNMQRRRA